MITDMLNRKVNGQAALDFMMSYGWAIALVVIVAAALFMLGIFDTNSFVGTKAYGFSGVGVKGWQMNSGVMSVKLTNNVGQRINITGISAEVSGETKAFGGLPVGVGIGQTTGALSSAAFSGAGNVSVGLGYQAILKINYTDMNNGFNATTKGTLTGKVISVAAEPVCGATNGTCPYNQVCYPPDPICGRYNWTCQSTVPVCAPP